MWRCVAASLLESLDRYRKLIAVSYLYAALIPLQGGSLKR
jgi:hypothetical protein